MDNGRYRTQRRIDALARAKVCGEEGEEADVTRSAAIVPGEHAHVAASVLEQHDGQSSKVAGAASDKDGRCHVLSFTPDPRKGRVTSARFGSSFPMTDGDRGR